jgi:PAS domain S-box-containing protein
MQQLVNTFVLFGTPLPKAVASQGIESTFATGRPQVTGLFIAPVVDQFMFGITVPVEIGDESRYVLGRSQDQHSLTRLIAANELPLGWVAVVTDAAHRIMARSEQEDVFIGKELHSAQWHRAGPSGAFEFVDSEGRRSLEAYVRSELTGWQTAVWAPTALLEARIRTLWWAIGLASLLAFALVFGFALWLGRIVARSVGQAARATIALKKGGPLPLSETPVAEVETLMGELRETAVELRETAAKQQAAESSLHESKDRLELALNAAQLGWWRYDPRRRIASWDPRAREILDIAEDETELGEFLKRVHPDDVESFWAVRGAALDPADPKPYASEYRVRRRTGEVRWVESRGLAYFEGAGPKRQLVNFTGTVQDITERREREEKEHLLMREINHRSKNMLSVVDAIAHLTAARSPEDFIERFSERIQALSVNQDLLVRNEWNGIEIEELVRAQLAHFADLISSRIGVHGPRLRFTAASAQAIGLALHELATNAGKYGSLSTDKGRVDVCWQIEADTLTMSWIEREGPPVSAPQRDGFGTVVMQAMAERSVGGKVEVDYAPSGLTWRLTCPRGNALEPRT